MEPPGNGINTLKSDRYFSTEHLKTDLTNHSVRGGFFSIASNGIRFLIGLISTVVLARLLSPSAFGLIAMAVAFTGFLEMFKDMGLSMATIQRREISHEQVNSLFWLNVVISILLMILTIAIAPLLAMFYNDPRLTSITAISSFGFLLGGLTAQHESLLIRQMQFGKLAIINIISMTIGTATGIVLAFSGARYWALVFMPMASNTANVIGVWLLCGWRPSRPKKAEGLRSMIAFGSHLTGFNILNYFARNLDDVLIGRFWGAGQLGFYSKAYNLLLIPVTQINEPITSVAIPALSSLQDDDNAFKAYFLKTLTILVTVTLPISVLVIIFSKQIVLLMLGDQWIDAVPIFQYLAISMIVQPVGNTVGWLYIAKGQTNKMLRYGFWGILLIIFSFFAGLPWGPKGIALAYSIAIWIWILPCLHFACTVAPVRLRDILNSIKYPFICSVLSGLIIFMFSFKLEVLNLNNFLFLSIGTIFYFLIYTALLFLIFKQENYIFSFLKILLKK